MKALRSVLSGRIIIRVLFLITMVVAFASTAMAASVSLSGAVNGNYTLSSMNIDSSGNITLSISSSTPPPPGDLSLGLNPQTLPTGTVGTGYNKTVTMNPSGGTSPYSYSCSGSGVTGITASNGSSSTCTISGTPAATGVFTVNFSVTDSAASPATASSAITFSVGANVPPGQCINIGAQYPAYLDNQVIPANSVANFCFTIDKSVTSIIPYLRSRDWKTNSHMFVSDTGNITLDQAKAILASGNTINRAGSAPWYSFGSLSNERLVLARNASAGDKYYVTVYNTETSQTSLVQLYWQAY